MELDFGALFEIIMGAIVPVGVWIFGQWHVKWKAVSKRLDDLEKESRLKWLYHCPHPK